MSDKEKDVAEEVGEAPAGDTAAEQVQETANSDARAEGDQPPLEHGELSALLEDARDKADEHWNQCLRLQADIENLRKRSERDLVNAHGKDHGFPGPRRFRGCGMPAGNA